MEATASGIEGAGLGDLACFEVHGRVYALDVRPIREIVRGGPTVPLPDAPPAIEGVMDLRDTVVPIVDLGRMLGGGPVEAGEGGRIVVVELEGLVLGLRVDAAIEVLSISEGTLDATPELAASAGCEGVRALVRRPGVPPLPVLSLEHLLRSVRQPEPAGGGPS